MTGSPIAPPIAAPRPLSPRARSFQHPKAVSWALVLAAIWGCITFVVWSLLSLSATQTVGSKLTVTQFLGGPFLLGAMICLAVWFVGERRARVFNRTDWALADGLAGALDRLGHTGRLEAYEHRQALQIIPNGRLIEIERHFDHQTQGAIAGTMAHTLRMFGSTVSAGLGQVSRSGTMVSGSLGSFSGSISGLSQVELGLSSTTRADLTGDALFAVFEAVDPTGHRDTYRVISMSQPAVRSWIDALVRHAADQFGGAATHCGSTVLAWSGTLMARFQPQDISYVTDRLKSVLARPYGDREPVEIIGTPAGRNAVVATSVRIGGGEELWTMPSRFPQLFGTAVAEGIASGEHTLSGGRSRPQRRVGRRQPSRSLIMTTSPRPGPTPMPETRQPTSSSSRLT
jgi:hypothetical protein